MAQEEVLVIERKIFEQAGAFNGLAFNVQQYLEKIFAPNVCRFMLRSEAEKNPGYKQIIPYVLISCGGKYLSYVRGKKAGESRLVEKRSIGIGGHINPIDDMPLFGNFYDTYLDAVRREINEEIIIETDYTDKIAALLNDDTNDVGKVHLGIVHHWKLDEPNVKRKEQMITQLAFMSRQELAEVKEQMESWSAICAENLEKISAS